MIWHKLRFISHLHNKGSRNQEQYFFFTGTVKNTKDMNNPALNESLKIEIHLGLLTTIATTRKISIPLNWTYLAMKKQETDWQE